MRSGVLSDALQLARRAERASLGLSEPEQATSSGIARRHVLAMLGTGAMAMAAPPVLAGQPARSVAIVGGGLAGLNALRILTEAGVDAHLYEARPRLGGRVLTLRGMLVPGLWEELGGQLVNTDHKDMIDLAKLFGIRLIDKKPLGSHERVIKDGRRVATRQLAKDLSPIASQIARDSQALDKHKLAALARLDRMSVADYLHLHRALITSDTLRNLLKQSIRTEFGVEPHEASAVELIFNLPTVHGQAFETLGASDERFVIEGGSGKIIEALASTYSARIETGRQLTALAMAGGKVSLRFGDGGTVAADRVILAIPPALLGEIDHGGLFSTPWQALGRELRLGNNEKINAAYGKRVWQPAMGAAGAAWNASADVPFAEVWEDTVGQAGEAGILTWFFGGDQTKTIEREGLRAQIEAAMGGVMGDLAGAALDQSHLSHWGSEPFTRGAYVNFAKGQFLRFGGLTWLEDGKKASRVASSGPVIFAGEHLSDAWPGYMNGAAQTGRLSAQTAMR
jgi:monoamine oxidase